MFAEHRRYLFSVAYRMLGIAEDAEDVVQEAWIRFSRSREEEIRHPRTYLVTIVSRLCVDVLRSARKRREEYVGVWLPEPVPTAEVLIEDRLEAAESASFAFLLMLERLSPLQRAVLVLHEVFDLSHKEIASAIGSTVEGSRQALRRARRRLSGATLTKGASPQMGDLVERFLHAAGAGDLEGTIATLAPEVVMMSDGGGRVASVNRPLRGNQEVGRFFATVGKLGSPERVDFAHLNGQTAVLVYENGALTNAFLFDVTPSRIAGIYVVRNPDKLGRLERLSSADRA